MVRTPRVLLLSDKQWHSLQSLVDQRTAPQREVIRAKTILHSAEGMSPEETAKDVRRICKASAN